MAAKITVEKVIFMNRPEVYQELEGMCDNVKVDPETVLLEPKAGDLIPLLLTLSKAKIPYSLKYEADEHQKVVSSSRIKK